jgi:hypothetical protein
MPQQYSRPPTARGPRRSRPRRAPGLRLDVSLVPVWLARARMRVILLGVRFRRQRRRRTVRVRDASPRGFSPVRLVAAPCGERRAPPSFRITVGPPVWALSVSGPPPLLPRTVEITNAPDSVAQRYVSPASHIGVDAARFLRLLGERRRRRVGTDHGGGARERDCRPRQIRHDRSMRSSTRHAAQCIEIFSSRQRRGGPRGQPLPRAPPDSSVA